MEVLNPIDNEYLTVSKAAARAYFSGDGTLKEKLSMVPLAFEKMLLDPRADKKSVSSFEHEIIDTSGYADISGDYESEVLLSDTVVTLLKQEVYSNKFPDADVVAYSVEAWKCNNAEAKVKQEIQFYTEKQPDEMKTMLLRDKLRSLRSATREAWDAYNEKLLERYKAVNEVNRVR